MNSHILPILSFLIALGIFFAYVNPTWTGSIATAKAAIAADDQALVAANQYAAQQSNLIAARDAINPADLDRLNVFLPDAVGNVGLILDLNALAARSGLSLSNIDVTAGTESSASAASVPAAGALPAGADPVSSVSLSLSAVGTYVALQNVLQGVERSERLLDIRDLSVKSSNTGVYTYQMTIRFYWLH